MFPKINFRDLNQYNFYNFYNLDIDTNTYFSSKYFLTKEEPDEEQKLSAVFLDIEVYQQNKNIPFKFDESLHPISAISLNFDKQYYCFFLHNIYDSKVSSWAAEFKNNLITNNYIDKDEEISIQVFDKEEELIITAWNKIKELKPFILSGFNSDGFDYPYIYRRLLLLNNNNTDAVNKILSEFEFVEMKNNGEVSIPEFSICDLQKLYKPRDDGGLNYGSKQASYTLDFISTEELGLKKFEYKSKNADLNEFYENDPKNYLFYNLIDVILCVKLNKKLKHIDLHNGIRRILKNSFSKSMVGHSSSFESYVLYNILKDNNYVRFGIVKENVKLISENELISFPKMKDNKKIIEPSEIDTDTYNQIITKFKGAHVNDSDARVIKDGSLIIDLDASSLYPSMMLQSNISFDVYQVRILPPTVYKFLNFLEDTVGKTTISVKLLQNFHDLCIKYVDDEKLASKEKTKKNFYYTSIFLLKKIYASNATMNNIYNPTNDKHRYLLQFYLLPLIDILNTIHTGSETYNQFVYDYLFDNNNLKNIYNYIYIVDKPKSTSQSILKLDINDALKYINKYSITIFGTCFDKHQDKLGLFTNLLQQLFIMRKTHQKEMIKHLEGSEFYNFHDSRQKSVKIVMNSIYGVLGLKSFRYSSHHLAQSITSQGRLSIKIAQYITEQFLKNR